ncbi:MAG: family 10 glycosylhydrolase, partial [Oscillospiraceae bacterium]
LEIMVKEAHERGLKIEAWVNPYRVALTKEKPGKLADTNPAVKFMADEKTADYVFNANNGTYYNPAVLEVQQLITDGVVEIIKNYEVDGIQFDDYFYPEGADSTFDEARYALDSREISLEDWRRDNVNSLIKKVYAAIKAEKPSVVFGISPQGNNDNNYNLQYSDVGLWLSTDGYVDYIMPQVYWGYNFVLKSGNDRFSYKNCLAEWLAMPKSENVKLYIGLGAFRLGNGDGSSVDSDEWQSGANLGAMIKDLKSAGADGYALYRYDSLFNNPEFASLAESEAAAIATENLN